MVKQRIYLSGKVRGQDPEIAASQFESAEKELTAQGFEVVNPLKVIERSGVGVERKLMLLLLKELSECDAIWMLEGWRQDSHGAACEYHFARSSGIKVLNDRPELLDEVLSRLYRPWGDTEEMLVKSSGEVWLDIEEMVPDARPADVGSWLRGKGFQTKVIDGVVCWILYDQTAET